MNEKNIREVLKKTSGEKCSKNYNIHGLNGLTRLVLVDALAEKKSSYFPRDPAAGMDMNLNNQNCWSEEQIVENGAKKIINFIHSKKETISSKRSIRGNILLKMFFEYRGVELNEEFLQRVSNVVVFSSYVGEF